MKHARNDAVCTTTHPSSSGVALSSISRPHGSNRYDNIAEDVIGMVISYMTIRERLIIMERVCKRWYKLSSSGIGWTLSSLLSPPNHNTNTNNSHHNTSSSDIMHYPPMSSLSGGILDVSELRGDDILNRLESRLSRYHNYVYSLRFNAMDYETLLASITPLAALSQDSSSKPTRLSKKLSEIVLSPTLVNRYSKLERLVITGNAPMSSFIDLMPALPYFTCLTSLIVHVQQIQFGHSNHTFVCYIPHHPTLATIDFYGYSHGRISDSDEYDKIMFYGSLPSLTHLNICVDNQLLLAHDNDWSSPLLRHLHFGRHDFNERIVLSARDHIQSMTVWERMYNCMEILQQCSSLQSLTLRRSRHMLDSNFVYVAQLTKLQHLILDLSDDHDTTYVPTLHALSSSLYAQQVLDMKQLPHFTPPTIDRKRLLAEHHALIKSYEEQKAQREAKENVNEAKTDNGDGNNNSSGDTKEASSPSTTSSSSTSTTSKVSAKKKSSIPTTSRTRLKAAISGTGPLKGTKIIKQAAAAEATKQATKRSKPPTPVRWNHKWMTLSTLVNLRSLTFYPYEYSVRVMHPIRELVSHLSQNHSLTHVNHLPANTWLASTAPLPTPFTLSYEQMTTIP